MSFASLVQPAIGPLVDRFATAGDATLIVGAGASMEAGLPSWRALIEKLLRRVAVERLKLPDATRDAWVGHMLAHEDLLAAAAVVEALASDGLATLLPQELYGDEGADNLEPGPIAREIATLRACFGERLALLTTNYDDLIERALRAGGTARVKTYVKRQPAPAGSVPVTHLHGVAGRSGAPRRLVLTEEQYHRMQRGSSWQEQLMRDRLSRSLCLFIGTTLTDPNLIRYLYGYKRQDREHAVVFVRQGESDGVEEAVRGAREHAVSERWRRLGVEAVFVDHFADAAQLLHEIGLRRRVGDAYNSIGTRAQRVLGTFHRTLLPADDERSFGAQQVELSAWLRTTLYDLLRAATGRRRVPPGDERLALALWLLGTDGSTLRAWAHSDRAHQDPLTMEAVPVTATSQWTAVRTVCQGVRVDSDVSSTVSRWRFVRGLPLVFDHPTRLPVGCLTISSTRSARESILTNMSEPAKTELHHGLVQSIYEVFAPIPEQFGA